jgi:PAS domain S-box-containing protein
LVALFLLHFKVDDPDEPVFLYTLPVLIVALARGPRDGCVAAAVAVALFVVWSINKNIELDTLGVGSRALALVLVALVGGYLAEELRAASEERRVLFDAASDGIFQLDRDGRIVEGNRATERLFGYEPGRLQGLELGDLLGPELDSVGYVDGPLIFRARRADGSEFAAEISIGFGPKYDTVIVRDVSARHRAELRMHHLLESGPDPVVIVDHEGVIEYVNARAESQFGWQRDDLLGKQAEVLIPPMAQPDVRERIDAYLESPERRTLGGMEDYYVRHADGSDVPVEITMSPLESDEGVRVTVSIRDITERRRIQHQLAAAMDELHERAAELETSNATLTDFAHLVSHDLREPLLTAALHGELLESHAGALDEQGRKTLDRLLGTLRTMRIRIDSVLEYARVRRDPIAHTEVDANEIVRQAVDALEAVISETGTSVVAEALPVVRGDGDQLSQVFQNLISNATKFKAPDRMPRVEIAASRERYGWHFRVCDNGVGVPVDERGTVFGMFERSVSGNSKPGSGVGLALCKKIIELHGGRIWIESNGDGSTVNFTLPAD